ncbi:MAG: class I SAM-dependent methyltransferase [Chloroflexi bacterium]|nr:class I SAM-dependent methyltransferase [Chloroflexota bacterium]
MQPRSWLFDELAHAGVEHLDPAYVASYDRKAQTDPRADLAHLRTFGLDEGSTLVDFGAGTGTFALAAAPLCRRVVAVDVSAPMLERLRERAGAEKFANIETVRSGFLTYRHRGEPADAVYSRNALHHLPDFWKGMALHRVAAALRPGGAFFLRVLVYSFDPGEASVIFEGWLARAPRRPEEGYTAADLATHIRTEYSTYTWLLEPMLERAGFEIRDAEYASQIFAAYTCIRR